MVCIKIQCRCANIYVMYFPCIFSEGSFCSPKSLSLHVVDREILVYRTNKDVLQQKRGDPSALMNTHRACEKIVKQSGLSTSNTLTGITTYGSPFQYYVSEIRRCNYMQYMMYLFTCFDPHILGGLGWVPNDPNLNYKVCANKN